MFNNTDALPCPTQEFLPPLSRWVQWGGVWIVGMMITALALSNQTQYRMTVKAAATVRPSNGLQLVQAATTGTVSQIYINEHQKIRRGDVMLRLDDTQLQTQKNQLEQRIRARKLQLTQIKTLAKEPHASIQLQQIELQNQLMLDTQALHQVKLSLSQTKIFATTDGAIALLSVRNLGQTVQPGTEIAQIVPSHSPLVIKAWVSTQDISQIRVGQITQLRLSACPYPDYGTLPGKVVSIAPDAKPISASTLDTQPFYEITVAPERLVLKQHSQCQVQVGMTGQIDVVTQSDTVLRALLRKARLLG